MEEKFMRTRNVYENKRYCSYDRYSTWYDIETNRFSILYNGKTVITDAFIEGVYYRGRKKTDLSDFTLCDVVYSGVLSYTNEQGEKDLIFGLCKNEFTKFLQDGYSDEVGSVEGNIRYNCAVSAAWIEDKKLQIKL